MQIAAQNMYVIETSRGGVTKRARHLWGIPKEGKEREPFGDPKRSYAIFRTQVP